jgi:hypothetical protein
MKIYILRAARSGSGWRLRFGMVVPNPVDAIMTTVEIGSGKILPYAIPLADALKEGAKLARHNFKEMIQFNEGAE